MIQPRYHDGAMDLYRWIVEYQLRNHHPPTRPMLKKQAHIVDTTLDSWLKYLESIGKISLPCRGVVIVAGIEYVDKREWVNQT